MLTMMPTGRNRYETLSIRDGLRVGLVISFERMAIVFLSMNGTVSRLMFGEMMFAGTGPILGISKLLGNLFGPSEWA